MQALSWIGIAGMIVSVACAIGALLCWLVPDSIAVLAWWLIQAAEGESDDEQHPQE